MAKRALPDDAIDPVRSRLAAAAAAVAPTAAKKIDIDPPRSIVTPQNQHGDDRDEWRNNRPARPMKPVTRPGGLTVNRKIMVTKDEADRIEATTASISAVFGSKVTYSQVSRAMWSILAGADDAIRAGARRAPKLTVPSKGDHIAMAEYEEALGDFLATALKRS